MTVLILSTAFVGGWWVNGWRWEAKYQRLDAQYQSFSAGVARLGEQSKTKNALIALDQLKAKERADEQNRMDRARDATTIRRMRDDRARAGGGGLSAPTPSPASPDRTCFDTTELAGALRSLDEGLLGIVEEGSKAVTDLNTVKQWKKDIDRGAKQ